MPKFGPQEMNMSQLQGNSTLGWHNSAHSWKLSLHGGDSSRTTTVDFYTPNPLPNDENLITLKHKEEICSDLFTN